MRMRMLVCVATVWAGCVDEPDPPIRGEHHYYVVSRQIVPSMTTGPKEVAMDINGDGTVDNQAGQILRTLSGQNFIQPQIRADRVIDPGQLIQLIDLQLPTSADGAASAGIALHAGGNPGPVPCLDDADLTCRRHLTGDGVFDIATPGHAPLVVIADGGGYRSRDGRLSMLFGGLGSPLELELVNARIEFDTTADGILVGRMGGALSIDELHSKIVSEYLKIVATDVREDCTALANPPTCGCASGSAGSYYVSMDVAPKDCSVSFDEFVADPIIKSLLAPDLVIDGESMMSLSIGFEAVPATIRQ